MENWFSPSLSPIFATKVDLQLYSSSPCNKTCLLPFLTLTREKLAFVLTNSYPREESLPSLSGGKLLFAITQSYSREESRALPFTHPRPHAKGSISLAFLGLSVSLLNTHHECEYIWKKVLCISSRIQNSHLPTFGEFLLVVHYRRGKDRHVTHDMSSFELIYRTLTRGRRRNT